ncbi:putative TBC domain protein [Aspergillus lucknowensis]|uniref:Rab-GTPase-TBC domain-containing protein n=1 Tax=Aspergillus lucknowensis TaxID=176173 RepID=A0ABR4LGG5_9EURO
MGDTRSPPSPAGISERASSLEEMAATGPPTSQPTSFPLPNGPSLYSEGISTVTSASSSIAGQHTPGPPTNDQDIKPDSELFSAPSIAKAKGVMSLQEAEAPRDTSVRSLRSIPSIVINEPVSRPSSRPGSRPGSRPSSRWSERKWGGLKSKRSTELMKDTEPAPAVPRIEPQFSGISLDIPTGSLDGLGTQSMRFSKRGSLIQEEERLQLESKLKDQIAGAEANGAHQERDDTQSQNGSMDHIPVTVRSRPKPASLLRVRRTSIPSRAISADEDMLSRRVRLMYAKGDENVTDSEVARSFALENGVLWEEPTPPTTETPETSTSETDTKPSGTSTDPDGASVPKREQHELAGGIEYWQNIKAGDVDRYGFIRASPSDSGETSEFSPLQRVSTSLLLASETPRRKRSIRPPSALASNRSFTGRSPSRQNSEASMRPASSQSMYSSPLRRSTSRFRQATNHLPHNRSRRFKDEAGDMLTLPTESATSNDKLDSPIARAARKKEWEREDKWKKMAKPTNKGKDGGGMTFEFDTKSSKLIERTWKGIPDRWRSSAWYAFLEASAKKHDDSPTDEELIEAYRDYQLISSPDDVQIDIDVPRTISSHIMFRRRYRGGQRLLFRVLHAMSLYFPDTGYVQGMAALAATLLAYYDEEHTFIMLVRLWQLRGLEQLYRSGFAGLMEALGDFEREWLEGGEVAAKLTELGIPPTAYGTRWYLTLFNYSIPFPAQLRVWDVFMLLGDADDNPSSSITKGGKTEDAQASSFGKGLDVLHATSAALIDGMREIILESDFENSMKVLTSWIPIKDVELFMRVAKAEWKVHRRKKSG